MPATDSTPNPFTPFAGVPLTAPRWRNFAARFEARYPGKAEQLPDGPAQGDLSKETDRALHHYLPEDSAEAEAIWAARVLRRPLLITGSPGVGKSSLAYVAAYHLNLGPVLRWDISSRSTLTQGLYEYDAIGRFQTIQRLTQLSTEKTKEEARQLVEDPGPFFRLGPLGTALLPRKVPRVLLIDEIDKSDIDFPNDLLNVLEEGSFAIPELRRLGRDSVCRVETADETGEKAVIQGGQVQCYEFPLILMTSNGERDFPAAFLRRCLRLKLRPPGKEALREIVTKQLNLGTLTPDQQTRFDGLAAKLIERTGKNTPDQLLSVFFAQAIAGFDTDRIESVAYGDITQSDSAD